MLSPIHAVSIAVRDRFRVNGTGCELFPPSTKPGPELLIIPLRLQANTALRNNVLEIASGGANPAAPAKYENALPLDISYLLTTNAWFDSGQANESHLEAIDRALHVLQDTPFIQLQGTLQQEVRLTIEPASTEELSRIWAMFPGAPFRLGFLILASPVWVIGPQSSIAPRVTSDEQRLARTQEG